jgi:DNA-binding winged helix-turn-helix (wHTH) protein
MTAARFGPFELDPHRRQLLLQEQVLHLTPKAFDLLWLLVDAAPRVVSKSDIHQRLWPNGVVTDATLVGLVKEIRRVLGSDAQHFIRTVHRVGYAFDAPVTTVDASGTSAPSATQDRHWLIVDGRRMPLVEGENVIGRDPAANVWLDYAGVSRRHARVTVVATSAVLEDLGSKNGTTLEGVPLSSAATLSNGDEFACGQLAITYRQTGAEMPTATEVSRFRVPVAKR